MIYTGLRGRLEWSWTKNAPDVMGLLRRSYPDFVFRDIEDLRDVVPVFTYHSVEPESFEAHCRLLAEAGYQTLDPDHFHEVLLGRAAAPPRSVLLSFDDGLGSLYAVAWPLLRRYGLRATAYVVSGHVFDDDVRRPNLDDVAAGRAAVAEVTSREASDVPGCTWRELREMQASGVVRVQSHSHRHALVHRGARIRDFINPQSDPGPIGHANLPMVRCDGEDVTERPVVLGRPIYEASPQLEGHLRYLDDEALRSHCERYVQERGGPVFFERKGWRRELHAAARAYRQQHGERGQLVSAADRDAALRSDLADSRAELESRLGEPVGDLCFPWYRGSPRAVEAARETGYRSCLWGVLPDARAARPGGDPFRVPRLDGLYVERLPSAARRPLRSLLERHYLAGRLSHRRNAA